MERAEKNLDEFLRELSGRVEAISCVQYSIIALLAGISPKNTEFLRDGINNFLSLDSSKDPDAKTLRKELKKYIDFIDRGPSKGPLIPFRVIDGGQKDGSQ
jgi:hypothetical protein